MTQTARGTAGASTLNASAAGHATGTPETDGSLAVMVTLAAVPLLALVAATYPAAAAGFVTGLVVSGAAVG
jgi:hypothetical protein